MESFRYIYVPVLLNARSRNVIWKMSNNLFNPTFKKVSIGKYRTLDDGNERGKRRDLTGP